MSENIVIVTDDDTFEEEVLNADLPVLVDFWASWCGPCKMFAPIFEDVASDYIGKIKMVKANVDEASIFAQKYGVRSVPTLILFKEGQVFSVKVGALAESQLRSFLDESI